MQAQDRPSIWILDGSVAVTGAFISARDMARALRNEVDVVLVLPDTSRICTDELTDFAAVYHLPIRPLRRRLEDIALYMPFLLLALLRLHRQITRTGAKVLLVNDFYLMQGPLLRLVGYRGRMLTWVRIDPTGFGRAGKVWLAVASRLSDHILAVSRHIQHLLPASMPNQLLYDSVSAEFLSPPAAPRGPDGYDFVFLGNYIEGKGQDTAITAMADLIRKVPAARLRFHGDDMGLPKNRTYLAALKQQAKRLGVSEVVKFGGFTSHPRSILDGAFAALTLSRSESFSRTVLEACACGLPVIATRCGGPEEIVEHGRTGLMIPIDDARACAEAMHDLCRDPKKAAEMGAAGRARVIQTFAPDPFATRLKEFVLEHAT